MKSIIKNTAIEQESEYPCLKIYDEEGHEEYHKVVLFTNTGYGTCVCAIGKYAVLGYTSSWTEDVFRLFNGVVELSN